MRLVVQPDDVNHHINLWLTLWQGETGITSREKEVLTEFIKAYMLHKSKGLIEPYLSKEVFSTEVRKYVCDTLSISSFNLTNVLASLKSKECIKEDKLDKKLIPEKELTFVFK